MLRSVFLLFLLIIFASWSYKEQARVSKECIALVKEFAKEQEKKYQMQVVNTGTLCFEHPYDKLWGIALMDSRQLTIEQARPIMIEIAQAFIKLLDDQPSFKLYLRNAKPKRLDPDKDPLYPVIAIKVAFWDKNVNRPPQPYVADMRFENGHITYYVADPKDQALRPQLTETLDEAKKVL